MSTVVAGQGSTNNADIPGHSGLSEEEKELAIIAAKEEAQLTLAEKAELVASIASNEEMAAEEMRSNGVVRINNALSPNMIPPIVAFIRSDLQKSISDVQMGKVQPLQVFSSMLSSTNRWDFKLQLEDPIVMNAMKEIFHNDGLLGKLMKLLVTENGELFELAAFCTSTGAGRQVVHADTLYSKHPALYTCAVALQDVSEDMGPTLFIPGNVQDGTVQCSTCSAVQYSAVQYSTNNKYTQYDTQTIFSYCIMFK